MNLEAIQSSIMKHEGEELGLYKCTSDKWSIGVGHNLEAKGVSKRVSRIMLEEDINDAIADLDRQFVGWRLHSDAVQNVLVELSFAMGAPRLSGFKKMWAALNARDYPEAAKELLDSLWADQVGKKPGQRASVLAGRLRNG